MKLKSQPITLAELMVIRISELSAENPISSYLASKLQVRARYSQMINNERSKITLFYSDTLGSQINNMYLIRTRES